MIWCLCQNIQLSDSYYYNYNNEITNRSNIAILHITNYGRNQSFRILNSYTYALYKL